MEYLNSMAVYWLWFIAAALFAIGEIIAPGVFLIFIAGAAACLGIITSIFDISVPVQLILFGILSVASVYLGRKYYQSSNVSNEDPLLNDRAGRMIGQSVTIIEPLSAATGRVKYGDSEWPARGDGLDKGSIGVITSVEDGILMVERGE